MVTASNDGSPSDDRSRSSNRDQSEVSTGVLSAVMEDYIKAVYAIENDSGRAEPSSGDRTAYPGRSGSRSGPRRGVRPVTARTGTLTDSSVFRRDAGNHLLRHRECSFDKLAEVGSRIINQHSASRSFTTCGFHQGHRDRSRYSRKPHGKDDPDVSGRRQVSSRSRYVRHAVLLLISGAEAAD